MSIQTSCASPALKLMGFERNGDILLQLDFLQDDSFESKLNLVDKSVQACFFPNAEHCEEKVVSANKD